MDILLLICIGLVVGVASGTLGIGGGVLLLPALVWICRMPMSRAAGTTLAVLVVPVVLPAVWEYYRRDFVDIKAALWIAAAFALGGYAGALLRSHELVPDQIVRLLFGLVMMYIAWQVLISSDSDVVKASAGIVALALALFAYWRLKVLGRSMLVRPRLQAEIERMAVEGHGDPDYYI